MWSRVVFTGEVVWVSTAWQRYGVVYGKHRQKVQPVCAGWAKIRSRPCQTNWLLPKLQRAPRREKLRPTARKIRKKHRTAVRKTGRRTQTDSRSAAGPAPGLCRPAAASAAVGAHTQEKKKQIDSWDKKQHARVSKYKRWLLGASQRRNARASTAKIRKPSRPGRLSRQLPHAPEFSLRKNHQRNQPYSLPVDFYRSLTSSP